MTASGEMVDRGFPASSQPNLARLHDSGAPSRLSVILSYAALLGGIITLVVAITLVVDTYSAVPYADGWDETGAAAYGSSPLNPAWLWVQHNEHRLVVPKLFLAADLELFQGRQVLLLASILFIQFLQWSLLSWSMWVFGGWRGAWWRTGAGLAAFCLFCPTQWENFVWGFQVCFVLPGLFATAAFVALLLYWRDNGAHSARAWLFLAAANLSAIAASYSLANGILLWPILILAAIVLRLRLPAILSFVFVGVGSCGLYLRHYVRPPWHADPLSSLRSPVALVEYLTSYLGSPWIYLGVHLAAPLGLLTLIGLAIFVVLRCKTFIQGRQYFAVQLLLTILFCLGTDFLSGLGRLNFGVGQSFASRYQTISLLFWCCLGLLALLWAAEAERSRVPLLALQIFLLVVMARGALRAPSCFAQARLHAFRLNQAGAALMTGVSDEDSFYLAVGLRPEALARDIKYLRRQRYSVFSTDEYRQLDTPLASTFLIVSADECRGAVESVTPAETPAALAVRGWAWDAERHRPPSRVLVAGDGQIIGMAAVGEERSDIRAKHPDIKSDFVGFGGYVHRVQPSTPLTAYAVLEGSPPRACPIATFTPPARQ